MFYDVFFTDICFFCVLPLLDWLLWQRGTSTPKSLRLAARLLVKLRERAVAVFVQAGAILPSGLLFRFCK